MTSPHSAPRSRKKDLRSAWMIFDNKKPVLEPAYQWEFERDENVSPQKLYLTFSSKVDAQKWLDKWHMVSRSFRIVPCTITITLPTIKSSKRRRKV